MKYINSPIEKIYFNEYNIFVKRDDLLDVDFSGNKARKFYYYLVNEFPNVKGVISHGSAQSNAMYSLSVLCRLRGWQFDYYVDHIASFLKQNPAGNYEAALKNGMIIHEELTPTKFNSQTLFIPEGGALKEAAYGIEVLAKEIVLWAKEKNITNLKVFLPSGTGTTALYLQKYLPFEVLTCACVGNEEYLKKQFNSLELTSHPTILQRKKKYHFGKLYKEFYEMYIRLLKETKIEFDLLYDPLGFTVLEEYMQIFKKSEQPTILYIHQGGLLGNDTMVSRYKNRYEKL